MFGTRFCGTSTDCTGQARNCTGQARNFTGQLRIQGEPGSRSQAQSGVVKEPGARNSLKVPGGARGARRSHRNLKGNTAGTPKTPGSPKDHQNQPANPKMLKTAILEFCQLSPKKVGHEHVSGTTFYGTSTRFYGTITDRVGEPFWHDILRDNYGILRDIGTLFGKSIFLQNFLKNCKITFFHNI